MVKFKLIPYFSIASLLACGAATASLSMFYQQQSLKSLIKFQERHNIAIAQSFDNSIRQDFAILITNSSKLNDEALQKQPQIAHIRDKIDSQMEGFSVVQIKIFDRQGRLVFSTDKTQIGEYKPNYSGFVEAISGKIVSKFDHRNKLQPLLGGLKNQRLLSTYLPIYLGKGRTRTIAGVIEVYSDVTPAWQDIQHTQTAIAIVSIVIFALLYLVLFFIIRVAARIIASQSLERQKAEIELAKKVDELAKYNAELQHFAYIASHDLQEPLRKIESFGDRLKQKYADRLDEQGRDYIERMQGSTRRMRSLIEDLLAFSRITTKATPFALVDLNKIVRAAIDELELRIQTTKGTVEFEDLPTIEADPLQMQQLFQNLIGNGLKFHNPNEAPFIKITSMRSRSQSDVFEIAVQDNGIGFDEKYSDRIFQVFQRLHGRNEYEGTGIGLAICAKIVARHGGTITAKSIPREGSTFIIHLPSHQDSTKQKP